MCLLSVIVMFMFCVCGFLEGGLTLCGCFFFSWFFGLLGGAETMRRMIEGEVP